MMFDQSVCVAAAVVLCGSLFLYHFLRLWQRVDVSGSCVVVTGAASGIGRELAVQLRREGSRVIAWDIDGDGLASLKKELEQLAGIEGVHIDTVDVSDRALVMSAMQRIPSDFLPITVLVNNAGVVGARSLLQLSEEEVRRSVSVNVVSHFWTLQGFLPMMIAENNGQIVTVASVMALLPGCQLSDYCSSKAAAAALHECVRMELSVRKATGVATTLICTGPVNTGMFDGILEKTLFLRFLKKILIPTLEADYVAKKIIEAIKSRPSSVYIPMYARFLPHLFRLLPTRVFDVLVGVAGGWYGMDTFRGRRNK